MNKKLWKSTIAILLMLVLVASVFSFVACDQQDDEYDENGNLKISIRNLYFDSWSGGDAYLEQIEEDFGVSLKLSSYSWQDWDSQVTGAINGNNMSDVFQYDLDSYNYASTYLEWVEGEVLKPLPEDMSKWPNLQKVINSISSIEHLKIDGKLYCLPIIKNPVDTEDAYSPFTYVYRRDWAKELGVYQENDIYTWEQFETLLNAFYTAKCQSGDFYALVDVEWGFPSVTNFYKTAPHCFAVDSNGNYVNNYTTAEYQQGLAKAKEYIANNIYGYDQYNAKAGDPAERYYAGRVGVFYENLSLSNYTTLRKKLAANPAYNTLEKLDDATAIMKVMSPDGMYCLEGNENWFSATMFNADISDEKMEKVLDILEWTLSEEGTMMATYGFEDYDYIKNADGTVTLTEAGWEKDPTTGKYIEKLNGAKFLRYLVTLGYDINANDPLVDKHALQIINDWYAFMDEQNAAGKLRILEEDPAVKWLSTPKKDDNSGQLLSGANTLVVQYTYGKSSLTTIDAYLNAFNTKAWNETLAEINSTLGK